MADLKIVNEAWVVACDGRKALILNNVGDEVFPDLRVVAADEHEAASTHDLGTDRPGRVHQRVGTERSAVEQTDWHDQEEEAFLRKLADRLDKAIREKETPALVIAAPPRALGVLRKLVSPAVQGAIRAEIDKDLTGMPVDQIEQHLFGKRKP